MVRRIGPVRGAGTVIQEQEGQKQVEPGALGWVAYGGILEKGDVGELIVVQNRTKFVKKCGGYIPDSLLPDACFDYYGLAQGRGGILLTRITDGNELQAEMTLYSRRKPRAPMGTVKAKNGGRWGGKLKRYTDDVSSETLVTNTTIDTENTTDFTTDQWKGGWIELDAVANKRYPIVSNTAAGVITVASNSTMKDDWTDADPTYTNKRYYVYLENENKALSVEVRDGEEKPDTEFGLFVYVDGVLAVKWPNLSVEPTDSRYWENIINNDDNNDEIVVTDLLSGALEADDRPANYYGKISAVTETVLTGYINDFDPDTTGDGDGTCALGTTTDDMVDQTITITFSAPTTFDAVSDKFGDLGNGTVGSLFTPNNDWSPPFTLTAGATAWESADVATLIYKPFVKDSLINGYLWPDKPNAARERYRIVDNDHKTITVQAGSDLTASGAIDDEFMVQAPLELEGGRDGIADLTDADYINQAWTYGNTPFDRIVGRNLGLVKMATPGVTSTAVQKAGIAYADAQNHQYRVEIPSATVTEDSVQTYVNDTIGRSDFSVYAFPSYAYVPDPEGQGQGRLKLVSCTGMIHGREAKMANDWLGYHKAEAGQDAILPAILKLPTGETILDEEILNPLGVAIIKKVKGNFVIWGDRTANLDPEWKWKHQREQMCYYENVLRENFDWIIFAINDPIEWRKARTALVTFFLPEWQPKRALQGRNFEEAAVIKVDAELNTPLVTAAGDTYAQVSLWLADTIERFNILIGKQGIFESVTS